MPHGHHHDKGAMFGLGALSAGAVLSGLTGIYKFSEAAVKLRHLYDVGAENAVYVRMIERVRLDLAEADRLLALPEVKHALSNSPAKVEWIRQTMSRCRFALEEEAKHTRSVHEGTLGGRWLSLRRRVMWVLEEHEKLVPRSLELAMCHFGLLEAITFLGPMEDLTCCQPESAYRARKNYYREANELLNRGREELPQSRFILEREQQQRLQPPRDQASRYAETRTTRIREPEPMENRDRDYAGNEEQLDSSEDERNSREYRTSEGDIVVEDRRQFASADDDVPRGYERVERRVYREYGHEESPEHESHRHRHNHSRDGHDDEQVVIKRRFVRKADGPPSGHL